MQIQNFSLTAVYLYHHVHFIFGEKKNILSLDLFQLNGFPNTFSSKIEDRVLLLFVLLIILFIAQ